MTSRGSTPSPDERQMLLPLSPIRNREFLSNHWLEHRLPLEPEWQEQRKAAVDTLASLVALWRVERESNALWQRSRFRREIHSASF